MLATLGDFFPTGVQEEFRERNLKAGSVFKILATNTTPPKEKRLVLVAVNDELALVGYLFINSEINLLCLDTDELRNLQIYLECAHRNYLSHDSYLDCSNLMEIPLEELKTVFAADRDIFLGELSEEDFLATIEKVTNAPTISNNKKRKFRLI